MDGNLIHFIPGLAVAGALGILVAIVVLQPLQRGIDSNGSSWVPKGTAGIALILLMPVVFLLFEQTQYFRVRELTEVGSAAFKEPPMSEAAALAIRQSLRSEESWATVTALGRCADVDLYGFYWLAFRLVPNPPNCDHPDVELYWKVEPPRDVVILARGQDYWVVRP